jgi:hypothetical protein
MAGSTKEERCQDREIRQTEQEGVMSNAFDFTGKETARLKAQHAAELAERQQQIGLTSEPAVQEFEGVFDPQTGLRLELTEEEAEALEASTRRYNQAFEDEMEEEVVDVGQAGGEWAVIKVSAPIENMTYGYLNTLSFVPGRRYRVSNELCNHLLSRGLAERVGR